MLCKTYLTLVSEDAFSVLFWCDSVSENTFFSNWKEEVKESHERKNDDELNEEMDKMMDKDVTKKMDNDMDNGLVPPTWWLC